MRWRRLIVAVVAGLVVTVTVVRVGLLPTVAVLQEAAANTVPAGLPASAYALVMDSTVAVALALTGAAPCNLGSYWYQQLGKTEMVGHQVSKRGGVVRVRARGDRVDFLGQVVTVMRGELLG